MIETIRWLKGAEAKIAEKIISAFPVTPPPNDQNLVAADIAHLRKCDECRNARQFFTGKTREIILRDERNYPHLVNAFDFFTPQAWHYYLPVFLIQDLIRQRHSFNHFWHHNEPCLIEGHWSLRIELMEVPQCEVLIEYLQFYGPYAMQSGHTEELCGIIEWWQDIYQRKLATVFGRV